VAILGMEAPVLWDRFSASFLMVTSVLSDPLSARFQARVLLSPVWRISGQVSLPICEGKGMEKRGWWHGPVSVAPVLCHNLCRLQSLAVG
jgi:hypothetical protein